MSEFSLEWSGLLVLLGSVLCVMGFSLHQDYRGTREGRDRYFLKIQQSWLGGLRSSALAFARCLGLPKMVNSYVFCSTATGLLGRTALGAKKIFPEDTYSCLYTSYTCSSQLFGLSGPRCIVGSQWISSWRATFQHSPELSRRLLKHCYIVTAYLIVSTAKSLWQLPVQKQLSSWWFQPEQLLCRFKTCWRRNLMKWLDDFARPKSSSSLLAVNAPLVHRHLMCRIGRVMNQKFKCLEGRVLIQKESLQARDIPSRKLPFEAAYGGMRSRDENEWARFNSILFYGWRFVVACPAGTHFLPVLPTLDDVRCH